MAANYVIVIVVIVWVQGEARTTSHPIHQIPQIYFDSLDLVTVSAEL